MVVGDDGDTQDTPGRGGGTALLSLPAPSDFTASEVHFAHMAVGLRRVGAMFHGRLLEGSVLDRVTASVGDDGLVAAVVTAAQGTTKSDR